jgi:histidine triad (HIT) family protein
MVQDCVFCAIAAGTEQASVIAEDDLTITFVDLRQFHQGHVLVVPRQHFNDIRDMDEASLCAVMAAVARATRAVDRAFPSDGISIWHSVGEGANQEVPHAHFHVHPRYFNDGMLKGYPRVLENGTRAELESVAVCLREYL